MKGRTIYLINVRAPQKVSHKVMRERRRHLFVDPMA
jgi:hypothetical protein